MLDTRFCRPSSWANWPFSLVTGTPDVNARNNGGWTALMFAARNGHTEAVKLLIESG